MAEVHDIRCKTCSKLLVRASIFVGKAWCDKCKEEVDISFYSQSGLTTHVDTATIKPD